jgi:peptidyl-prolyl cis-trans isomerase C
LPTRIDCATSRRHSPQASATPEDHAMTLQFQSHSLLPLMQSAGVARICRAAALTALMFLAAPAWSQDADPVVAKVNGTEIRQSDLALAEEDLGPNAPPMSAEAKRDYLVAYVSSMLLVAKAAETKKVTDTKDFKTRLAFARNKLLMEHMLQSEAKAAATDASLRKAYDEAVSQMSKEQEVRARHILVPTEKEAQTIVEELKKGTDFAELAKQKSKDPGAAAQGGDLGYFSKDQMVPEFADIAFKLDKGQLSDPVKTQFGWHVIQVQDKRSKPTPQFEEVKDQVESYVVQRAQAEFVNKLREAAKLERLDKPAENKPAENKPAESKPAEKK